MLFYVYKVATGTSRLALFVLIFISKVDHGGVKQLSGLAFGLEWTSGFFYIFDIVHFV